MSAEQSKRSQESAVTPALPEWVKNAIERVVFVPARLRHWRRTRPNNQARTAAIETTRNTLSQIKFLQAKNMHCVFNVGLYLLLLDQDMADTVDDIMYAHGPRKRRFAAKHLATLLYEAAEDLPQLLGKEFRNSINALGASREHVAKVNHAASGLNQFWVSRRAFLKDIRNAVGAHREHDALRYLETLERLDTLAVMNCGAELTVHLNQLIGAISDLASLTVGLGAVFEDMKRSSKKA